MPDQQFEVEYNECFVSIIYLKKGWGHHIRITKKYHSFCEYRIKDEKGTKKEVKNASGELIYCAMRIQNG